MLPSNACPSFPEIKIFGVTLVRSMLGRGRKPRQTIKPDDLNYPLYEARLVPAQLKVVLMLERLHRPEPDFTDTALNNFA